MRILAADIGGTNARFAIAEVDEQGQVELGGIFTMATQQKDVGSFLQFWNAFENSAPGQLADKDSFDAVSLGLAGSASKHSAVLPNIDWNIRQQDLAGFNQIFLINDFVAQAYALIAPDAFSRLQRIRNGEAIETGSVALVGAGTGLGHCALIQTGHQHDDAQGHIVVGSEAGHASFSFHGEVEKAIEQKCLQLTGKGWLSNDDMVSGPGAALLHECLSGNRGTPAEALAATNLETVDQFSRFYARACRNYCLNIFPVRHLVISGGLAQRNPYLVSSSSFADRFNDGGDYRELLARIPISLNTDPHLGLSGAAIYAAQKLVRSTGY